VIIEEIAEICDECGKLIWKKEKEKKGKTSMIFHLRWIHAPSEHGDRLNGFFSLIVYNLIVWMGISHNFYYPLMKSP
jgi:hypothetical protein